MSAAVPLLLSLSPAQVPIQNSTDSFLDQTSQLPPVPIPEPLSSQASAFALEKAFSKVASLLPQLWGKGTSRPGAIEHYETLETSFSTGNQRIGAQSHLEVSNAKNHTAPEHSP